MTELEERSLGEDLMQPLPVGRPLNLVLIGKTGQGKSETGNTILGEDLFETSDGVSSCTTVNKAVERVVGGRQINLVDTPGCMDTSKGNMILNEIAGAVVCHPEGYNAFLMVCKYPLKMTDEEILAVYQLEKVFGEEIYNYAVVIFTHGDVFQTKQEMNRRKGKPVESFDDFIRRDAMSQDKHTLGPLFRKVNNRVLLFNNATASLEEKREAVVKLVNVIDQMGNRRRYDHFLFARAREIAEENPGAEVAVWQGFLYTFLQQFFQVVGGVITIVRQYLESRNTLE